MPNNPNSSSSHRLPTLTASQALQQAVPLTSISTNLPTLDHLLQPLNSLSVSGLQRSQVSEIYGPPGSGKTALGMQIASLALRRNESVVWLNTAAPIPAPRFQQILNPAKSSPPKSSPPIASNPPSQQDPLLKFYYTHLPSLAHLLTLLLHPTPNFPPPHTTLLILDNLSPLLPTAPKHRFPLLITLSQSLRKFALLHNLAIVILNPCGTSIRDLGNGKGRRAILRSAVVGKGWEEGVGACVCLYRDFVAGGGGRRGVGRFAEVLRGGRGGAGAGAGGAGGEMVVRFEIRDDGLHEMSSTAAGSFQAKAEDLRLAPVAESIAPTPMPSRAASKRKAGEIADSEDEDEDGDDEEGSSELPGIQVPRERTSSDDFGDLLDGDWEALVAAEKGLGEEGNGDGDGVVEEEEEEEEGGDDAESKGLAGKEDEEEMLI